MAEKNNRASARFIFCEACDANVRWLGAAKRTAGAAHRQGDRQYSPSIDA
jgi:hypothetical protein